jgi:acyl-CoA synthetase (NDP forming)
MLESFGQGVSAFVSCGNEVDLELTDYLDHLLADQQTKVVALVLDGVSDGARFRGALRRAKASDTPVVALKLGNTTSGTSAAQAHSSRLAGTQASYEAVFRADGVVSVPTLETLAVASAVLASGRAPRGPGVTGFSTSGAGGILLADTLGAHGVPLSVLSPQTQATMAPLAGFARVMNPFDIGAAGQVTIERNLEALAADPGTGSLIFYLTPVPTPLWRQALADGVAATAARHRDLPILVVSPAPVSAEESAAYTDAGVPVVRSLLDAVTALSSLVDAAFPGRLDEVGPAPVPAATGSGRALSEPTSKRYLAERGLPMPRELVVTTVDGARKAGTEIGYPVVLKAAGAGLTHKSEEGLVVLDVPDEPALEAAFEDLDRRGRQLDPAGYEGVAVSRFVGDGVEVVLGVSVDPDFGPMVLFGSGGVLTELVADVAVAPAPLDVPAARALVSSAKVARLLAGYRGSPPADVDAVVDLLVGLSQVAVEEAGALQAIDLNPVRVLPVGRGIAVLDALVVEAT